MLTTTGGQSTVASSSSQQFEAKASTPQNLEPQPSQRQSPSQSSIPQLDQIVPMMEGIHDRISGLSSIMYSHNNHVQIRLTTIETQLDQIQRKLESELYPFVTKRGRKFL